MEFRILGPLEVLSEGHPVALGGSKQRALLAALLLHANEVVSSSSLVEALWEEQPPETAGKALQVYVSQLRKSLGRERVQTREPGYVLRVEPDEFDLDRCRRLIAEGRPAEALTLWRGPPLSEFAYKRFAQGDIARLEELRLSCLEQRIEQDLADGRHLELVGELEMLVIEHPVRERLRALLMLALYRSGRQAEALETFQEMRRSLTEELGIEPSRFSRDLHKSILRQDPSIDIALAVQPAPKHQASRLVGRERELAERDAWPVAETRKTVTVLFADVAGSTALGEALDPEAVRSVMKRFSTEARTAIERHGGTVEKFIGDAVMAVFGVPAVHEDDALRAVRAASEIRERLVALNSELERERGIELALRMAVNTGEVVAGDASSGEFYATGDAINVAARLELAAAPGEILLGEATYLLVRDRVQAEGIEPLTIRGKAEEVPAYRFERVRDLPALVRRIDSPFVGRRDELAQLRGAFERVVAEQTPLLITVLGPAGIGKTRLVAELTLALGERATVLEGRCLSYGEGITFLPLQEILRSLPERPAEIHDPEQARSTEETFWAYRKLFERLAKEHPLVLVLEDIHWAEPTLLEFLEHVIEWTQEVPLLVLAVARTDLLDSRPGWPGQHVELASLGEREATALLSVVGSELADSERMRIAAAAEGNPLFLEQMVAFALEENGQTADLPPTIQSLLAARVDRLEAEERALFEAAAVIGREFWRGALLELSPPGTEVSALLQRLVRRRLVRPEHSSFPGQDAFRFAHVLIRDTGYSSVPKERRAGLHERFAGWLEQNGSPNREIIGYHLEQAYRYRAELGPVRDAERELASRAGTTLAQAGLDARQRGDATAAANLLSRGLELLHTDAPSGCEFLVALADSHAIAGDFRAALPVCRDAIAAARMADDQGRAWEAILLRDASEAVLSPGLRSFEELLREAERAAAALEMLDHERGIARAWSLVAIYRNALGRFAAGAEAAQHSIEFAHRAGDWHLERASLGWLGQSLHQGRTPASEAVLRCEEIRARTDDPGLRLAICRRLSGLHAMLGHADEARGLHEHALEQAAELGRRQTIAGIEMLSRALAEILGPVEAEASLRRSLAYWDETGNKAIGSTAAAKLAHVLCAQGRYTEAKRYAAIGESAAADDYESHSLARAAHAKVQAHSGKLRRAEPLAREAVAIVDRTDDIDARAWLREDLAEVLSLAAKAGEAFSVLEDAIHLAEEKEDILLVQRARGLLAVLELESR